MSEQWKNAFRLAVLNDLIDLTPLGAAPLIGDLHDALTTILSAHIAPEYAKTKAFLIQLAEFLPFSDLIPIHTIAIVKAYADTRNLKPIEALRELAETKDILPPKIAELLK